MRRSVVITPGLVCSLAACGGSGTQPTSNVASFAVSPDSVMLAKGDSTVLTASPLDADGHLVTGVSITFVAGDTTIIHVSAVGLVHTSTRLGTTTITISGGGASRQIPAFVKGIFGTTPMGGSPFGSAVTRLGATYVLRHTANAVSRFNLPDTNVVTTFGIADNPTFVTFDSSGTTAFVTAQFAGRVEVITVASNQVTDSIAVTGDPFIVRVSPDNHTLWVSTNVDSLYQIDRTSKSILASYGFAGPPNGLAFSPVNDSLLYTSTLFGGTVVEINYKRHTIGRTFSPGGTTQAVVVSPDGTELYVANEGTGEIDIFNLASGAALPPISIGAGAFDLELSPDRSSLWTSLPSVGEVRAYGRVTRAQTRRLITGGVPRRIAFAPSANLIVVPNEAGWVDFLR